MANIKTPSNDLVSRTKQATEELRSLDPNELPEVSGGIVNGLMEDWAAIHPPLMLMPTEAFVEIMLTGAFCVCGATHECPRWPACGLARIWMGKRMQACRCYFPTYRR